MEEKLQKLDSNINSMKQSLSKLNDSLENTTKIIENLERKIENMSEKIDGEVLIECKKMGGHIDFVEKVYDNVKHPLGYIMKKISNISTKQYTLASDYRQIATDNESRNLTNRLIP